jgi:hypothetical protein
VNKVAAEAGLFKTPREGGGGGQRERERERGRERERVNERFLGDDGMGGKCRLRQ